MKLFGLHINAVNGQCKCSPFRLQCLLFALTSVFWSVWAFHHVLFICMFCSRCSLFSLFFFQTQEFVFKRRKTCQGSRKSTNLSSSSLFNSFSFHFVHSLLLLSTVVVQLCVCVWGGVLPLRGFLCFWPIVPPPPSSFSSLMGPSSLLTAPKFC